MGDVCHGGPDRPQDQYRPAFRGQRRPALPRLGRVLWVAIVVAVLAGLRVGAAHAETAELAYGQRTTDYTNAATTLAGSADLASSGAFTYDGSTPVLVEVSLPSVESTQAVATQQIVLVDGTGAGVARLALLDPTAAGNRVPVHLSYRFTPAAGSRSYAVRVFATAGTETVHCGAGGDGSTFVPCYVRVTRANPAYAIPGHDHDDRYYTKTQSDARYAASGGVASTVSLSDNDKSRLDAIWWGIWISAGILLFLSVAPAVQRAFRFGRWAE